MKNWTLVNVDDWQALYDPDGKCVKQDHRLAADEVCRFVGVSLDVRDWVDEDVELAYEQGRLPDELSTLLAHSSQSTQDDDGAE